MSRNVQCPLHGFITLTPLMCKIVDTPEFKRLHNLRQTGAVYCVYPSANHTRFEHSIGVAHLATILIKSLQTNQPELNISDRMVELVQIAGLIHDIGHGPFSHLYDDYIIDERMPKHERRGIFMFQKMVESYNLELTPNEIETVIHMIEPPEHLKNNYLYQIIANKVCSIDVDKIDYIQRDSFHIGFGTSEKYERLLTKCRVVSYTFPDKSQTNESHTNGSALMLTWPEKLQNEILSLFQTRYRLHKEVYTHHTVKSCEYVISDILKEMLGQVKTSFNLLNDSMINWPVSNKVIRLKTQFDARDIPKMIGEKVISYNEKNNQTLEFEKKLDGVISGLNEAGIANRGWSRIKIGFISGQGVNPLTKVIYLKHRTNQPYTIPETSNYNSFMVPNNCQEFVYRIYINASHRLDYAKSLWNKIVEDI